MSECYDCAPGTARVAPGGSVCAECDRGHFSNESRAAVCVDCPEGRFAEDFGSSECEPCSPGWFEQSTGASVCDVCGETNFNPDPGQDMCLPCQQGLFGPVGNDTLTACLNCTVGRRGTADGQNECPACAQGRFNDVEGLDVECKACARGRYAATIGLSVCTNCLRGQYSTQPAATAASFCQNCSIARFVFSVDAPIEPIFFFFFFFRSGDYIDSALNTNTGFQTKTVQPLALTVNLDTLAQIPGNPLAKLVLVVGIRMRRFAPSASRAMPHSALTLVFLKPLCAFELILDGRTRCLTCSVALFLGSHVQEVRTARIVRLVSFPAQILLHNAQLVPPACFCKLPERLVHAWDAHLALPVPRGLLSVQFVVMERFQTWKMQLNARHVVLASSAAATTPTVLQRALLVMLVK